MAETGKTKAPGRKLDDAQMRAACSVLCEQVIAGQLTYDEVSMAVSIGCGVMKLLKQNQKPSVPADEVIMWLGQFRDSLPGRAIDSLQTICRRHGYGT